MRIVLLKAGSILREGLRVLDARSSVTLVESGSKRIIVDTGMLGEEGILVDALAARGLAPGDIDIVFNTHLHIDHCGCNLLFKDSIFYADKRENPPVYFQNAEEGKELVPGATFLSTPGHTEGSASLLVRTDQGDHVIAGDALPTIENYRTMTPPAVNIDEKLALQSMKRIVESARYITPGHGATFEVVR